jgi:methyltransferase family protein
VSAIISTADEKGRAQYAACAGCVEEADLVRAPLIPDGEKRMHEQPTPDKILQTGLAFWPSKTLLSAIELGVFAELSRGLERFDVLSGRLGLHPRAARDFLDTLVALGFLRRKGDSYRNTPETDLFLDRKKPSYIGGILDSSPP